MSRYSRRKVSSFSPPNLQIASQAPQRLFDNSILYIDSGVATVAQISNCLKSAIKNAEKILGRKTNCRFKINLLVNKDGEYFGYGYIWISSPEIYWMLLGRNPNGTERIEEYPDPDWKPPSPSTNENKTIDSNKNWIDIVEEEDAHVQPMIKKILPPLVALSGYEYDSEQIQHLKELKEREGQQDVAIPKIGFFEISRGYALDAPQGSLKNRLCARNVPDWIPEEVFKAIFSFYIQDTKGEYPIVKFVTSKNGSRIVFITFDPNKKDAIFTLLMTKKTVIVHPNNPKLKASLIFSHAYDNSRR